MAVHYCFAASKRYNSVPCMGDSLSLTDLEDAIAAPLVASLHGKKLKETFDLRVYDSDTGTEILGANSRIRKHASVIVKRVPYFQLKSQSSNVAPISTQTSDVASSITQSSDVPPICTQSSNGSSNRSEVIDDDFGDEIYSAPQPSSKSAQKPSSSIGTSSEVTDDEFGDNVYSTLIMPEAVKKSSKNRAAPSDEVMSNKRRFKENIQFKERVQSVLACKQMVEASNIKSKQETGKREESAVPVPKEFTCSLCNKILKEPTMIPCCFLTFCGDCIKEALAKQKKCPNCQSCKFGVANLLHNRHLNIMIDAHFKSSELMCI